MTGTQRPRGAAQGRVTVAAAAAVAAAVTGIVLATTTATTPRQRPSHASAACITLAPFGTGSAPIPGGQPTTIALARSAVGFPIIVPHNPLADRRTLSGVWISPAHVVALAYRQRKITILITRWPVPQSPGRWFRHERRIMIPKYVRIGHVNGGPALIVLKANIDYCHANPALVEFYWRRADITVFSRSYPAAALLRIADSMR